MTGVPIIIGALGTVLKGLIRGREELVIGGRAKTIQTTVLLRRVLETLVDLVSLRVQ